MTLIITNNKNTVNMVCKYINIKDSIIENLSQKFIDYIDKEIMNKNLEQIDKIIIDITECLDSEDEILKSITKIKLVYDIQIIIIALKYRIGNKLLSDLFNIGIYDFIIAEDEEEQNNQWIKALNKNDYIDALEFRVIENNKKKKIKKVSKSKLKKNLKESNEQVSKKILSCFYYLKNECYDVLMFIWYILVTFLISVGATALLNSNIRQLIIEIIQGGK